VAACKCGLSDDRPGAQCRCESCPRCQKNKPCAACLGAWFPAPVTHATATGAVRAAVQFLNRTLKIAADAGVHVDLSVQETVFVNDARIAVKQVEAEFFVRTE
jgi:hypothetical protein